MSKKLTRNAIIMLLLAGGIAFAQSPEQNTQSSAAPQAARPETSAPAPKAAGPETSAPAARPDPARQMQLDLDQMDSLVNNMAAQVGFIHDTNMSILLNTNVRLWMVLIRDLRMQLQQQPGARPAGNPPQR